MRLCALSPAAIAESAANALREELETFPKPGLVSFVDHGSHPDMSAECFLVSIEAITPGFAQMAEAGAQGAALRDLQQIGLAMEDAMFAATSGRNTHRGAIFCLGLLSAAAGRRHLDPGLTLGEIISACWGRDIPQAAALSQISAGIAMCQQYHLGGVRREAALGFPTVYRYGLPALGDAISHGRASARVQVFFALLEQCEDTTLLKRGGLAGQEFAREEARRFLQSGGVGNPDWLQAATEIHREFVRRNLTAGGAADLLAATLFSEDIERTA